MPDLPFLILPALPQILLDGWSNVTGPFTEPTSRLSWTSLIAAIAFAALAYRVHILREERFRIGDFLRFLVPAQIYRHPSFRVDVGIFILTKLLTPVRWLTLGLSVSVAAGAIVTLLESIFGRTAAGAPLGPGSIALLAVLLVLAFDFGTYVTHRLSHRLPLLWAFHRVHHSARELNPLTVLRKHPVYDALAVLLDVALVAPIQGVIIFLCGAQAELPLLVAVNLLFGLFGFAGSSLRHSHIWFSFGRIDRLLVSPAMHQIHHSQAQRHWDRNYGEVFSIWDWMFGSLYLPRQREELSFGLSGEDDPHPTVLRAMSEPFVFAARTLRLTPGAHSPAGTDK